MSYTRILSYAFNRGIISPLALARFDLKRLALSAQICANWMFRTLGSMMLRPGLAYVDSTYNNVAAVHIPFIFSIPDTAIIELTNTLLRVRINEQVLTRVSVVTAITNGNPFVAGLTSWTSANDAGGVSVFSSPYMALSGNGTARGVRYQNVTVSGGDANKEHAIRIVVAKGYVTLRVGTSAGDDSYIANTVLNPGTHSLAFTPTGNFTVQVSSATIYTSLITSIAIESAGAMTLPTLWPSAMLGYLRWEQSGDVVFVASDGTVRQQRIERRGTGRSWSIVDYLADDGPFLNGNIDQSILLTPSGLNGDITLATNIPFFKSSDVGRLFSLLSTTGQNVSGIIAGAGQSVGSVQVTGIGTGRNLTVNISGTWVGTIQLRYSVGAPGAWINIFGYTGNQTNVIFNDGFDNQIIFYQLNFTTYSSGSATVSLSFAVPGQTAGTCRIDSFTNAGLVSAHVLKPMWDTQPTTVWSAGIWSSDLGYPTAVSLYEGRLWWFGNDYVIGSISDAYSSYDQTRIGDSGPIIRTIAQGPVSVINWALALQRMIIGCDGTECSVRSDSLDAPLSPTNFNIKSPSTRGSAAVAAAKIDTNGVYVQRGDPAAGNISGTRLIQIAYQGTYAIVDYTTTDLSEFAPELVAIGIKRIAVQRKIDTRIHCLLNDGTVAVCVYNPIENEKGFLLVQTEGAVEDIFVLPGSVEDKVYYVVNRTINGSTVRYLERWALESECAGGQISKNADSHIVIANGSPSTAISAPHLAGETVTVWADGRDVGTQDDETQLYTLDGSGNATLAVAALNVVVGTYYKAQFQSVKLTQTLHDGTSLGNVRSIDRLGVVLANSHYQGLKYGKDFDSLEPLPLVERGAVTPLDTIWEAYDNESFEFNGVWEPDSRLCLEAAAPRPCTVLACQIGVETSGR